MKRVGIALLWLAVCVVYFTVLIYGGRALDTRDDHECASVFKMARTSADTVTLLSSRQWSRCAALGARKGGG